MKNDKLKSLVRQIAENTTKKKGKGPGILQNLSRDFLAKELKKQEDNKHVITESHNITR
jgi:hypothetical protein